MHIEDICTCDFSEDDRFERTLETPEIRRFLRFSDRKDREYLKRMTAAIGEFEEPEKAKNTIDRYLSRRNLKDFNLVNPHSRKNFRECLLMETTAFEETRSASPGVVMFASFVDRAWACCDRAYDFDYGKAKQKIRNACRGMNFIAVIEPAIYPHSRWEAHGKTGCLVSFHCHSLTWSTSESKLQRHRRKVAARFEPVDDDDTKEFPVLNELKTLMDVLRVLRYMTKMPSEGYRKKREGGKVTQQHTALNAGHHYRLFKFLRQRSLFDAWFAGGSGAPILKATRRACENMAVATERHQPGATDRRAKADC